MMIDLLPDVDGAVVVLSGGLDSTIAMRMCVEKYGNENVRALTFDYGQKQRVEISRAEDSTFRLGVKHKIMNLSVLHDLSLGFSANVDGEIKMPTIQEVLGDPTPKTYVPNRNMILLSLAAAYAEKEGIATIVTGLQATDQYNYWDTTPAFIDAMNAVFAQNRKIKIRLIAPFSRLSKAEEIEALRQLDGDIELLEHTLTCYNPDEYGHSCGDCPSCSERIAAFRKLGLIDPVPYQKSIPWSVAVKEGALHGSHD